MQNFSHFCRVIAFFAGIGASNAHAGALISTFADKPTPQGSFKILLAPIDSSRPLKLPKARVFEIASGANVSNVYMIMNYGLETSACYIPDSSLVSVLSSENRKAIGYLNWPPKLEVALNRCRDRSLPDFAGKCLDGQSPSLKACGNGDNILILLGTLEEANSLRSVLKLILNDLTEEKTP